MWYLQVMVCIWEGRSKLEAHDCTVPHLSLSLSLFCSQSLSLSFFLSPGAVNVVKQNLAQKMVLATFDQPWNEMNVQSSLLLEFHTLRHCQCDSIQEKNRHFHPTSNFVNEKWGINKGISLQLLLLLFLSFQSLHCIFLLGKKSAIVLSRSHFSFNSPQMWGANKRMI